MNKIRNHVANNNLTRENKILMKSETWTMNMILKDDAVEEGPANVWGMEL